MATNNPRKNRQRTLQQSAAQTPSIPEVFPDAPSPSASSSDSSAHSPVTASPSGEISDASAKSHPVSADIPPITIPGAKSNRSRLNAAGERPSVKQSKKVSSQKSGKIEADAGQTGSDMAGADAGASGSIAVSAQDISGSGSISSNSQELKTSEEDGSEASVTSGVEAAQAFRMEKQIEREQLALKKEKIERHRRRIRIIVGSVVTVVIASVVAVCIAFSVFRWHTYDDAADIQGTWNVAGSGAPVTITEDTIELTEDVAYKYVIDPEAKTISFTFGNLEGHGHYRFSLDRNQLAITDGEFTWTDTLADDAGWSIYALADRLQGNKDRAPAAEEEGTVLLERM